MPSASGTQNGAPASSRPPARPSPPADYDPNPDTDPDLVLAAERAHLVAARQFLRLMRENVLSLEALGGDRVSVEYLKADLHRRAESLHDLPDTPLFFGRLDYSDEITWPDSNAGASQQTGDQPGGGQLGGGQPGGRGVAVSLAARRAASSSAAPFPASSSTSAAAMSTTRRAIRS